MPKLIQLGTNPAWTFALARNWLGSALLEPKQWNKESELDCCRVTVNLLLFKSRNKGRKLDSYLATVNFVVAEPREH